MSVYVSTAYLAPIQYYSKFLSDEIVFIEYWENYVKQTYRNRCTILSANGKMILSVPVEHSKGGKVLTKDIRIAHHNNWQHLHWNALISAYNSSPFFEYYRDDFQLFYEKKFEFLFDFNEQLRILICELIGLNTSRIKYTEVYSSDLYGSDSDFRNIIHPKKDWKTVDSDFVISKPYYQVFAEKFGFIENLSIVDLLFNMGNESILILKERLN